eukprot:gene19941-23859_t
MATSLESVMKKFQIVVAATRTLGIGKEGTLPWKLPGDMKHFKALTSMTHSPSKKNAVVMGRKTWESIPEKFRPMTNRVNVILSRSLAANSDQKENTMPSSSTSAAELPTGVHVRGSLQDALELLSSGDFENDIETVFVIGGAEVYKEALASEHCEAVHITKIERDDVECDAFFPTLDPSVWQAWSQRSNRRDNDTRYHFVTYVRAKSDMPLLPPVAPSVHEETQYLDLVREIVETGVERGDRTGTGTLSVFGRQMRFDLRHGFPLLTTKRVFWRGVAEELLWFVRGSTNAKDLQDKGIRIWDGNGSREYLDSIGLSHREENDLGPVYGFQWRHFNAEYSDCHADYTDKGIDQLAEVIHKLRHNPNDRRIIMTAWNPAALKEMALPPCHMFAQMYQRSGDMGLGVPFNIASYALLTCLLAHCCDLKPAEFVHTLGDAHVYKNHVEPLEEQLLNKPRPFPILKINTDKTDIDQINFEDLEIVGYAPHKKIAMEMAV